MALIILEPFVMLSHNIVFMEFEGLNFIGIFHIHIRNFIGVTCAVSIEGGAIM